MKKLYVETDSGKRLHAAIEGRVCRVLPLDDDGWLINYYIACESIEAIQDAKCEVLRFKDGNRAIEIPVVRAVSSVWKSWYSVHDGCYVANLSKKWANNKKKQQTLFG